MAAIAVITNFAAGMQSGLSHEQTLAAGAKAAPMLTTLIESIFNISRRQTMSRSNVKQFEPKPVAKESGFPNPVIPFGSGLA